MLLKSTQSRKKGKKSASDSSFIPMTNAQDTLFVYKKKYQNIKLIQFFRCF